MRAENPDHWVNKWLEDLKALRKEEDEMLKPLLVLVDDVRYSNEVAVLRDNGGTVCFVKHGERAIDDPKGDWRKHESEQIANELETLDDIMIKNRGYHYVIHNDGDVDHLPKWAKEFINKVAIMDDCPCEACTSAIENRPPDSKVIDDELRNLLDDINDLLDEEEGND